MEKLLGESNPSSSLGVLHTNSKIYHASPRNELRFQ